MHPKEFHTVLPRVLDLKAKRGHVRFATTVHNGDLIGSQPPCGASGINCGVASADDHDPTTDLGMGGLIVRDECHCVENTGQILAFDPKRLRRTQSHPQEYDVESVLNFVDANIPAYLNPGSEFDPQRADHRDLLLRIRRPEFVLRDTIGIQPAGHFARVEHGDAKSLAPQFGCARKRRGTSADTCHSALSFSSGLEPRANSVEAIHRMALQSPDLDGRLVIAVHNAGAFAQHVDRTYARTAKAKNIRIQNRHCRAAQVPGGYLLNEARHIDMGGASRHARRVVAKQAAVCFHHCLLARERRVNIGKSSSQLAGTQRRNDVFHTAAMACDRTKLASSCRMNSSTSVLVMFMGGEIRSTFP